MGRSVPTSALYNRYVRKLDQQETDVEKMRQEIETLKTIGDSPQRELQGYLLQLDEEKDAMFHRVFYSFSLQSRPA
jgi:hypothetical protein